MIKVARRDPCTRAAERPAQACSREVCADVLRVAAVEMWGAELDKGVMRRALYRSDAYSPGQMRCAELSPAALRIAMFRNAA